MRLARIGGQHGRLEAGGVAHLGVAIPGDMGRGHGAARAGAGELGAPGDVGEGQLTVVGVEAAQYGQAPGEGLQTVRTCFGHGIDPSDRLLVGDIQRSQPAESSTLTREHPRLRGAS